MPTPMAGILLFTIPEMVYDLVNSYSRLIVRKKEIRAGRDRDSDDIISQGDGINRTGILKVRGDIPLLLSQPGGGVVFHIGNPRIFFS